MAESWYWPAGSKKDVAVTLEQGEVRVHARAELVGEGLGHEGRQAALLEGHLLHDGAEGHDVVRHRQGVGEAQVDLVLAGPPSWWENCTEIPICSSMRMACGGSR